MFRLHEEHEFQTAALKTETEEKTKATMKLQKEIEKLNDSMSELATQRDHFKQSNRFDCLIIIIIIALLASC